MVNPLFCVHMFSRIGKGDKNIFAYWSYLLNWLGLVVADVSQGVRGYVGMEDLASVPDYFLLL